jgi:type I restriction enzyme R subunit
MTSFTESVVEDAALAWLEALGYAMLHGPDIAVGEPGSERSDPDYRDVVRCAVSRCTSGRGPIHFGRA